ncbi:FAD binding domain-containing protein [Xylariales sp. PMI_506]|nr:FAD binding domain-containing protein [Xylariales sp. PMI_506]
MVIFPPSWAVFVLSLQFVGSVYAQNNTSAAATTCSILATQHPELTLYPQNATYAVINEDYWSAEDWLGPACIFTPTSAGLMAYAIQTLTSSGVSFSVRGAGGMPILGAANINSTGILLAATKLTLLQISDDRTTVAIGAGNTWADVYDYLDPYGLTAVGGRLGIVGVSGCLLGGCMSFLSNEYGWGSASVVSFEAVLANGTIITATATNEYSDLFWALRGGGNSFAIVTRFDIKTLDIPTVTVGQVEYKGDVGQSIVKTLHDYAHDGAKDNRTFVLPNFSYVPAASPNVSYSVDLFYRGNDTAPAALVNFTQSPLTPASSTFSARSMANWTVESDEGTDSVHGETFRFYAVSLQADLDAMYTLHDIFFNHTMAVGSNITGFISTMAMNTVTESFIIAGRGTDPSGDPMGIDAEQAPYMFTEMTVAWAFASDTPTVAKLQSAIQADVEDLLSDFISPFVYLNNAGGGQSVFNGYSADNVARLKTIRDKYDPSLVYTNQLSGGFKLV